MRILIITLHIPPITNPRSGRSFELARELARQGHEVTVYAVLGKHDYSSWKRNYGITVKPVPVRWQVVPYHSDGDARRVLFDKVMGRLLGKLLEFPNSEFYFSVGKILKKEKDIDLLLSIAKPHAIHWGCARARRKDPENFPKTWIADCGDPFMENGKSKHYPKYFERFERSFCEEADFITVPIEEAKDAYYKEYRNKIRVIPQGFAFTLPLPPNQVKNKIPHFAYAGTFAAEFRNPKHFLDYLVSLNLDFRFTVFTLYDDLINPYREQLGEKLEIRSFVPRQELLEFLKQMDFVVNIENKDMPNQLPSKLIDYAIINRPILSLDPEDPNTEYIDQFLNGNYEHRRIIPNLEQYQIDRVAKQFLELAEIKSASTN